MANAMNQRTYGNVCFARYRNILGEKKKKKDNKKRLKAADFAEVYTIQQKLG